MKFIGGFGMKKVLIICVMILGLLVTQADAKQWVYPATSLTGGGTGALDAIDGQNLQEGDTARVTTSAGTYDYYLDADAGLTESSPRVISPDTNAGTKRWILVRDPSKYFVNPGASDQGTDGNDYSLLDLATTIGTTKKATVILPHTGSGTTTQYTIGTALDLSSYSNITFQFENGSQLKVSAGVSGVTLPSPANVNAQPNQQIVSGTSLYFSNPGTVYPHWFGAKADGSNDDTLAIQYAMVSQPGGILKFIPTYNYYKVTTAISGVSNITVEGSGTAAKIFNADPAVGTDISLFSFSNNGQFTIRDLYLVGSSKSINAGIAGGKAILLSGCTNAVIQNNVIEGMTQTGVFIRNSNDVIIQNNRISQTQSVAANLACDIETYATNNESTNRIWILNNECLSGAVYGIANSLVGTGTMTDVKVIGNYVYNKARHGIYLYSGTYSPTDCVISNNTVKKTGWMGIYTQGSCHRTIISHNHVENACQNVSTSLAWAGISFAAVNPATIDGVIVEGNSVSGTSSYSAIRIDDTRFAKVINNSIKGDGVNSAGTGVCAIGGYDNSYSTIQGNTVEYTGVEGSGIWLLPSVATTQYYGNKILDNHLYNVYYTGIILKYNTNAMIRGNVVDGASQIQIYLDDCSDIDVIDNTILNGIAGQYDIDCRYTAKSERIRLVRNKLVTTKATGTGIKVDANAIDIVIDGNDLSGMVNLSNSNKINESGSSTVLKNNKYGYQAMSGTFTCSGVTTSVNNVNVVSNSKITIGPTNPSAATLMGGAKSLFVSGILSGTSFAVRTADGNAPTGDETFYYLID
jgi:parallel beta-helix repeat protein